MKHLLEKPFALFLCITLIVCTILFTLPINMFDGEMVFSVNGIEFIRPNKLSLSYFFGFWLSEQELVDVKTFYLTTTGYVLAGLMTLGLPALITYRIWLTQQHKKQQ